MTSTDTAKRVGIYCRISRADNDDTGQLTTENIDRQERTCRSYAETKGWIVTDVFADNSISGGRGDRPNYIELQNAIDDKEVDVVLATDLDRYTRDTMTMLALSKLCMENEVELWTTTKGFYDPADDNSELLMFLDAWKAQGERKNAGRRQKRKRLDKSIQGEPLPGRWVPFGWKDKKMQEIDLEEAKWVKKAFELWNTGTELSAIRRMLNEAGMRKDSGKIFALKDVRYMLNNEKYCGWVIREDEVLTKEGKWESIIDSQTYEIAQDKFKTTKTKVQRGNKPKRLLSGKLSCLGELDGELCLTTMTMNDDLYRCTPASYGCGKNTINIYKLENYIIHELIKPMMEDFPETQDEPTDNTDEISAIDDKLDRLKFLFAEGDMTTDAYTGQRNKLRAQRNELISESTTVVPIAGTFEKFLNSDVHTQREFLNALIPDKIRIRPNITGKHELDPNRIDIRYLTQD